MKFQIEVDKSKLLAESELDGEHCYWLYDDNLTDRYMLLYIGEKQGVINYIHICYPDNFVLQHIEQEFKNSYFNYDLLETIKQSGE